MRIFEATTLMDADTGDTIVERKFEDGSVEFWSVLVIQISDGHRVIGDKKVPYSIEACSREEAFTNLNAAAQKAAPAAQAGIQQEFESRQQKLRQKIMLAPAVARSGPALGRMNGG